MSIHLFLISLFFFYLVVFFFDGAVPKQSGPVVVRGLGRYLELKDLAKRLDKEKKSRQKKAFLVRAAKKSNKTKKGAQ